jgi:hypothetical protein
MKSLVIFSLYIYSNFVIAQTSIQIQVNVYDSENNVENLNYAITNYKMLALNSSGEIIGQREEPSYLDMFHDGPIVINLNSDNKNNDISSFRIEAGNGKNKKSAIIIKEIKNITENNHINFMNDVVIKKLRQGESNIIIAPIDTPVDWNYLYCEFEDRSINSPLAITIKQITPNYFRVSYIKDTYYGGEFHFGTPITFFKNSRVLEVWGSEYIERKTLRSYNTVSQINGTHLFISINDSQNNDPVVSLRVLASREENDTYGETRNCAKFNDRRSLISAMTGISKSELIYPHNYSINRTIDQSNWNVELSGVFQL